MTRELTGKVTTGSTNLMAVERFIIPRTLLDFTLEVLAAAGRGGDEAFVVWGARQTGKTLQFRSAIVPEQEAHNTETGLLVTVSGEALFKVNQQFFEREELLAGQVHSHPTEAYHSDTDDCFSLVTQMGALSVVVPDFATDGVRSMSRWAWYRLTGQGIWTELTRDDKVVILRDDEEGN